LARVLKNYAPAGSDKNKTLNSAALFRTHMKLLPKRKVAPQFRLADDLLTLRELDTNIVVNQLEENIRIRELPLEKRLRRARKF
jgi:hypothetical protein